MTRQRRGRTRAETQGRRVGEAVALARSIAGMTKGVAARRAGLARSTWERIERGDAGVSLKVLVAATDAVGADLVCTAYPGREPTLRDSGQLAFAQAIVTMAAAAWRPSFEEPAGEHGEAIDLVLWGASEIICVEIESLLADWQAQSRRHELKRTWLAARHARPVRLVTVLWDRPRNRTAVAPFAALMGRARPAGTRAVRNALRSGQPLGSDGIYWMRRPAV